MTQVLDEAGIERLEQYFADIGEVLGDERRRASFATYAMGPFGEGERKSVELIAGPRACQPNCVRGSSRRTGFMDTTPGSGP
jgi:SRSO17 transposase